MKNSGKNLNKKSRLKKILHNSKQNKTNKEALKLKSTQATLKKETKRNEKKTYQHF